jgi:hypothetical protein
MRQRDLSAVQDCSSAFASMTWHVDCHAMMIQQRAVPTLLEMSKLNDQLVHSNVAIALCNLCHSDDITSDLVDCGVVPVLIALAKGKSDDVKRRCAAALDKLSGHPTVQEALMDASVMKSLVGLVGTRDKLALLETPHRSLPPLLGPPPSLVPQPEMAEPLPPLPPRGDNFDDNISNKLLNQAFTRSARCVALLCRVVLCCVVLCCVVLCCVVLCCVVLCWCCVVLVLCCVLCCVVFVLC